MRQAIILFTRVPVEGKTKTRLMPFLSGHECAKLHRNFIKDIFETCRKAEADLLVFYTPECKSTILTKLLGEDQKMFPQQGEDLEERMKHAFAAVFREGYEKAVLIGTDIPMITVDILNEALEGLSNHDAVICPAADGGYYLIGMTGNHESIWNARECGSSTAFENALKNIEQAGLSAVVGPVCRDIDTKDDLIALYKELNLQTSGTAAHTAEYLRKELKGKLDYADTKG